MQKTNIYLKSIVAFFQLQKPKLDMIDIIAKYDCYGFCCFGTHYAT
jgi:hypothetical protein